MQIHELNNYTGSVDSGSYLAIDNGLDTGKLSASALLAGVENNIDELDNELNARIDNIIAGGDAPSEAEVTDARLGAAILGSVLYNSLGAAIRGQVTILKEDINRFIVNSGATEQNNYYVNANTGEILSNSSKNPHAISGIPVHGDYMELVLDTCPAAGVRGFAFYDGNGVYISGLAYTIDQLRYLVNIPANAATIAVTSFAGASTFGIFFGHYQSTDKTLSINDAPADSATTGEEIAKIKTALTEETKTTTDTPTRAITANKSGFMLPNKGDIYSIRFTPKFSSTSNPFTAVLSGTFRLTVYNIVRGDTITVGDVAYAAKTYNIGDEVFIPILTGEMFCSFDLIRDQDENQAFLGYMTTSPNFANILGYISGDDVTTFTYGCAMDVKVVKNYAAGTLSILKDKKITVIGDSITEHNYRALTNWSMWLSNWTGCIIQNLGISGSGFIRTSPYINRIASIQSTPDIIGIAMTWNDLSPGVGLPIGNPTDTGTASIAGYVNDFFDALITAYPSTPIIAYIQSPWGSYRPGVSISDEYISVMKELLALKGVPFYDEMYYGSTLKPWIIANRNVYFKVDTPSSVHYGETDDTHPNSLGHKVIARILYSDFVKNTLADGMGY